MSSNRTILVTGGAGYIGSHACKALHFAGFSPVAFDNLIHGHSNAVQWGPFEKGDILDRDRLDAVIRRYQPAAMMHFAAFAYVGESVKEPGKYFRNNVVGSLTLLEAARDHGISNLVFSSSCATYGVPRQLPIDEDALQNPINPYGLTKLVVEKFLLDFDIAHGIKFATLRYFNAAGADPDGCLGEDHRPETHLIPLAIKSAIDDSFELAVYGTDYPTPDGTAIRDFIHVSDLADAHVAALNCLLGEASSMTLNLGTGIGHSVQEVINATEAVTGRKPKVRYEGRRIGDPPCLVADPTKAYQRLNWRPRHSDLSYILETAYRWHLKLGA